MRSLHTILLPTVPAPTLEGVRFLIRHPELSGLPSPTRLPIREVNAWFPNAEDWSLTTGSIRRMKFEPAAVRGIVIGRGKGHGIIGTY